MGVLGKLLGGYVGMLIGGPIGAILGAVLGHAVVDRKEGRSTDQPRIKKPEDRQVVFIASIVIMAAKLCKVDGRVTRDEISTFRKVFSIPTTEIRTVAKLFDEAKKDSSGYEVYARQFYQLFGYDRELCREFVAGLVMIACADGTYLDAERHLISEIARILRLSDREFSRIEVMFAHTGSTAEEESPYEVLGVGPDATDSEIKAVHREIIRNNHPDLAMARGVPEELLEIEKRKVAAANAAYDKIKKMRKAA